VLEALWWGAFGSSSLVIGAVFALRVPVNRLVLGLVMGFGAGVLLSAVAFELVEEAFDTSGSSPTSRQGCSQAAPSTRSATP
jgi:zinc transporter, ZIP family